ncbi:Glycine zipper 2TM domain-containing protein [Sphingomonas sp. OV641]|uniref:glycine zipper 2TM domain-containing protein n=1 Tax=Sphingomonas sp. OV641 TaxID=1881068 RepID=UPI0008D3A87D|nr:glycine zipper 2TM domain-containing protein [Sphingomonas sp. OV641]SEJ39259.1 Glycine zipper 2TM domain-containing protein [Sphingomonas sp. OV641]
MRIILAAALAATTVTALPVQAQANREYREDIRDARRDYRDDMRRADSRRDVRDAQRDYRRDVRDARQDWRRDRQQWRSFDYNRLPPGQRRYYADNFYRDGRYYQQRRLSRNDRVYRGYNGRYYCRRSDGTTGLIIGGIGGGVLGSLLANGGSNTLGALIGAGAGALLGSSVDRGQVVCR